MHIPYESDDSIKGQENWKAGILRMPEVEAGKCQDEKADE